MSIQPSVMMSSSGFVDPIGNLALFSSSSFFLILLPVFLSVSCVFCTAYDNLFIIIFPPTVGLTHVVALCVSLFYHRFLFFFFFFFWYV